MIEVSSFLLHTFTFQLSRLCNLLFEMQILVATPGRLRDHVENTSGFATQLMGVQVLVLDEADHLLDMGFRKEIERIVAAVPKQRQTLLFSATIAQEVIFILGFFSCCLVNQWILIFKSNAGSSNLPHCIEEGPRIHKHSRRRK